MLLNLLRLCEINIGDKVASPLDYFPIIANKKDIWGITDQDVENKQIILGGGGIAIFREAAEVLLPFAQNIIAWGVGCNESIIRPTPPHYPKYFKNCKLISCRDINSPWDWVPCVSCMSPLFDQQYETKHEVGFYEHWEIPLWKSGFPFLRNNHNNFTEVISFLSSCETIVTNSYHGAYWAVLLGKKVLVEPINTKLLNMKHQPGIILNKNWEIHLDKAKKFPEALSECRAANLAFYEKMRNLLHIG